MVKLERSYLTIFFLVISILVFTSYDISRVVSAIPTVNNHLESVLLGSPYIESQGLDRTVLVLSGSGARNGVQASFAINIDWTTPGFAIGGGISGIHNALTDRWVAFGTVLGYKESDAWFCGPSYDLLEHVDYYFDFVDQGWRYKVEARFHHRVEITNRPFCIFVETEIDHHDYTRTAYPLK